MAPYDPSDMRRSPLGFALLAAALAVAGSCRAPGESCEVGECPENQVCVETLGGVVFRPKRCVPREEASPDDATAGDSSPTLDSSQMDAEVSEDTRHVPPDAAADRDGDLIADRNDNCPRIANPEQNDVRGLCEFAVWTSSELSGQTEALASGNFAGGGTDDLLRISEGSDAGKRKVQIWGGSSSDEMQGPRTQTITSLPTDFGDTGVISRLRIIQVLDYDGVDKFDLIVQVGTYSGGMRPKQSPYVLFRNDGSGVFTFSKLQVPQITAQGPMTSSSYVPALRLTLELSGDAYRDLVAYAGGEARYAPSNGADSWSDWKTVEGWSTEGFGPRALPVDVDLDGDRDVLAEGGTGGGVVWLENKGDGSVPSHGGTFTSGLDSYRHNRFQVGTFSGDEADLMFPKKKEGPSGSPVIDTLGVMYGSSGASQFEEIQDMIQISEFDGRFIVGSFTGNSRDDVLMVDRGRRGKYEKRVEPRFKLYAGEEAGFTGLNSGTLPAKPDPRHPLSIRGTTETTTGDFNGDGQTDFVGRRVDIRTTTTSRLIVYFVNP